MRGAVLLRAVPGAVRAAVGTVTRAIATVETFESLACKDTDGAWFWSARDLQFPLGYVDWRNFEDSIQRAMAACANSGESVSSHFGDVTKVIEGGVRTRVIADYRMSRFGAYLVAMNGDPRKPEIAAAQTYFAVQTRRAEVAQREMSRLELIDLAREAELERLVEKERRELAESKVAELTPLASFADELIIADGDFSVREAAQVLCRAGILTGERRLFATLKGLRWIQDAHRAFQRHIDIGRVRLRTDTFYDRVTGDPHVTTQIRITAKGLKDLHGILGNPRIEIASP